MPGSDTTLIGEQPEKCPIYVEWDGPEDPQNPFNWPRKKKWAITALASCFCFMAGFTGSSFAIGITDMEDGTHRIHSHLHELSLLALSLYPVGFGVGPLLSAPLSEVYGRRIVFLVTGFLFAVILVPIGLSHYISGVLICRFLAGLFASTGSTLSAGVVADIWITKERGVPMAIFSTATFSSMGSGPALMGLVVYWVDWRWIQFVEAIANFALVALAVFALPETRGSTLLSWKAKRLRKETGNPQYIAKADEERATFLILVTQSLSRPLYYLISEPIVIALSLWIAFVWAELWGLLESISLVFGNVYGFNLYQQGLAFLPIVIGTFVGTATNIIQERLYQKNFPHKGPEARLYFACVGGLLFSAGAFIMAFAQPHGHWIGSSFGIGILSVGLYHIYAAIFNYLADAYLIFASSAIAAQSFARNLAGAAWPLFTAQMYNNLGYTWAAFLIAMISVVLAIIPFILFFKGKWIRSKSKVVQEFVKLEEEQAKEKEAEARIDRQNIS